MAKNGADTCAPRTSYQSEPSKKITPGGGGGWGRGSTPPTPLSGTPSATVSHMAKEKKNKNKFKKKDIHHLEWNSFSGFASSSGPSSFYRFVLFSHPTKVLSSFTGLYRVIPSLTKFSIGLNEILRVLLGFDCILPFFFSSTKIN